MRQASQEPEARVAAVHLGCHWWLLMDEDWVITRPGGQYSWCLARSESAAQRLLRPAQWHGNWN